MRGRFLGMGLYPQRAPGFDGGKPAQLEDNVAATRLAPLPQAVMADLASWYSQRVRPHVRGDI
jgi:hypothetical protein